MDTAEDLDWINAGKTLIELSNRVQVWEVQPVQRASTVKCLPGPLVNISVLQSQVDIYTCCGEIFFFFGFIHKTSSFIYHLNSTRVFVEATTPGQTPPWAKGSE